MSVEGIEVVPLSIATGVLPKPVAGFSGVSIGALGLQQLVGLAQNFLIIPNATSFSIFYIFFDLALFPRIFLQYVFKNTAILKSITVSHSLKAIGLKWQTSLIYCK